MYSMRSLLSKNKNSQKTKTQRKWMPYKIGWKRNSQTTVRALESEMIFNPLKAILRKVRIKRSCKSTIWRPTCLIPEFSTLKTPISILRASLLELFWRRMIKTSGWRLMVRPKNTMKERGNVRSSGTFSLQSTRMAAEPSKSMSWSKPSWVCAYPKTSPLPNKSYTFSKNNSSWESPKKTPAADSKAIAFSEAEKNVASHPTHTKTSWKYSEKTQSEKIL